MTFIGLKLTKWLFSQVLRWQTGTRSPSYCFLYKNQVLLNVCFFLFGMWVYVVQECEHSGRNACLWCPCWGQRAVSSSHSPVCVCDRASHWAWRPSFKLDWPSVLGSAGVLWACHTLHFYVCAKLSCLLFAQRVLALPLRHKCVLIKAGEP